MHALGPPFAGNHQTHPEKSVKTPTMTVTSKKDEDRKMKAATWHGKKNVKIEERPVPLVTDPKDAIIRVTTTCICGSDLHMYVGTLPGMQKRDILGHEFMGIVEDVGPEVQGLQKGDRVVCSCTIGCGQCDFCDQGSYNSCENSNPSDDMLLTYGAKTSAYFGYGHLTGGWEGGQAEYVRVPIADLNCLKVPDHVTDEKAVMLGDILSTSWHLCEMGDVHKGDVVAIWGCGPGGMLTAHCAFVKGAARVILIDDIQYRLDHALKVIPGVETINFSKRKVYDALKEMVPRGPDVCLEMVGCHYTHSLLHKIELAAKLETDPSDLLNEMLVCCRKSGRVAVAGMYIGYTNHYNFGAFMEKALTMRAGQIPTQKYWRELLKMVEDGVLDPTIVITHVLPLEEAAHGFKIFNDKTDNCVKVLLKTDAAMQRGDLASLPAGVKTAA